MVFSRFAKIDRHIVEGGVNFTENNALRGGAVYADKESTSISILDRLAAESIFRDHIQECPLGLGPVGGTGRTLVSVSHTLSSFNRISLVLKLRCKLAH